MCVLATGIAQEVSPHNIAPTWCRILCKVVCTEGDYELVTPYLHQSMRYKVAAFEAFALPLSIAMALGGGGDSPPIATTRDPLYLLIRIVGCLSCFHEQGRELATPSSNYSPPPIFNW